MQILLTFHLCIIGIVSDLAPTPSATEVAPGVFAPSAAIRFSYARSGGPGGQNVNKVNSKVEMWVLPERLIGLSGRAIARLKTLAGSRLTSAGEIHFSADTERGQEGNRAEALRRLRELVVRAKVEPKPRRKTKPTRASKTRRLEQKRRRSEVKAGRRGGAPD
jgi:ribosome-associated protein